MANIDVFFGIMLGAELSVFLGVMRRVQPCVAYVSWGFMLRVWLSVAYRARVGDPLRPKSCVWGRRSRHDHARIRFARVTTRCMWLAVFFLWSVCKVWRIARALGTPRDQRAVSGGGAAGVATAGFVLAGFRHAICG